MATVNEVSDPYANFMVTPAPPGPGVCAAGCHGFPTAGYSECHGCGFNPPIVDLIVPITYSVHLEQMHTVLRGYKEDEYQRQVRTRFRRDLTAVLWRWLVAHEPCVAAAAGVDAFDVVTTVPSNTTARDNRPGTIRTIVGELCGHTTDRYRRVLMPTDRGGGRNFDPDRYRATEDMVGAAVLLIDDTWTSGSKAQSAAWTLKEGAGAGVVACVPVGRHVHRDYAATAEVLKAQPPFTWDRCAAPDAHP